mmetsp:Transcript_87476/g.282609  ORF Transcript_87476/g.282609 Transcript_87476/m.282609 type:complete len:558 (+) Transcript_87476:96-1769(+)
MGTSAMLQSALETTSSSSSSSSPVTGSTTRRRSKQVRRSLSLLASFALPFAVVPASADERLKLEIPAHFDDHELLWGSRVLMPLADRLTSEVAALRTELEALRKERGNFDAASSLADPARWSNPDADHGRTLFLTMCAGSHYFDTYCGPFFASFERAYGASARRHRLVAFVADVDEHLVEAARKRFSPWGQFESLKDGKIDIKGGSDQLFGGKAPGGGTDMFVCKFKEDGTKMCLTDESSKRDEQVAVDSLWFPWRIISYLKEHEADFCYAAVLDSDMLFVRPLGRFLPLCTKDDVAGNLPNGSHVGASWDVAFTAYGPEFRVPWADDAAKVGRTKAGLTRINCGVVLLSLQRHELELARRFMAKWVHVSYQLLTGGERDNVDPESTSVWKVWQEMLLDEFRGTDQAGLVLLVCSYKIEQLFELLGWGPGKCRVCEEDVEASLALFADELPLPIRFRAFPAFSLNHPEAMVDGAFAPDLHIVHLKGLWWRAVLNQGLLNRDATRSPNWHRDALALQRLVSETWQMALPLDIREAPKFPVQLFDTWPKMRAVSAPPGR